MKRAPATNGRRPQSDLPVRYAVVGLGHIAQIAVLPAFAHARRNTALAALVSGDAHKLDVLGRRYGVPAYRYSDLGELLARGDIDAVYIALPNSMHADCAILAARAGLHVLCEKPMATTEEECDRMIEAARDAGVQLMIAYRLHFERANLEAIELVRSGKLGEPRLFTSEFSMQVKPGDIRLRAELGGGPLYDIGIYCINAARYLFRDEPEEVAAWSARRRGDRRFTAVDEMTTVLLRFPGDRLATFACSFGAADVSAYRIVGTKGSLRVEPAYEHSEALVHHVTIGERSRRRSFPRRDQFAPELLYFSDCIRTGRRPEPGGAEGRADVRIVEAILEAAHTGKPVRLVHPAPRQRPTLAQEIHRPPARKPAEVRASSPHR